MHRFTQFARRRPVRQAVWKTLNGLVGIITILNLSLAGTFLVNQPSAQALDVPPMGRLTVHKLADGNGDGTFESVDPTSFKWFLFEDPETVYDMGSSLLTLVGGKIVSETGPGGYQFTGWNFGGPEQADCTHPIPPIPALPPFVIVPVTMDQETVITLCNVHDTGFITVNKNFDDNADGVVDRTNPAGWTWDATGGAQDNAGGSTLTLFTDTYTVTEDALSNYSTSWSCSNQSSGTGTSLNAQVTKSTELICTFRNTRVFTPPSLTIAKTDNHTTANPGETLTYQITLTNGGELNATGVRLVDTIPADVVSVANISDGGTSAAGLITWDNLTVPGSGSKTVSFNGTLRSDFPVGTTTVHNLVTLSCTPSPAPGIGVCAFSGTATDDTSVTVAPTITAAPLPTPAVRGAATAPDLSITKRVDQDTANPGDVVTYTIELKSTGTEDARHVVVSDTLPAELSFAAGTGRTRTWELGTIALGQSKTVTVDVRVESDATKGDYVNVATAVADGVDPKQAEATLTVAAPKVLGLAEAGVGLLDILFFAFGAALLALGLTGFYRRFERGQLTLPW